MPVTTRPRGAQRDFDLAVAAFVDECGNRFDAGRALASADADRLWILAHRMAADVSAWTTAHQDMALAQGGDFPPDACANRLIETLFDDALTPCAARVLSSALGIALAAVTAPPAADPRV
jgi:hypothetical protein